MLDADLLTAERRRFFVATKGGVYFPAARVVFWGLLGGLGFVWSERTWCVVVLCAAVVATPVAIVLFKKLVAHLALKSLLATLILPTLLPVALSLGMAAAVFREAPALVPLALVIGLASHWPAVGWMFETLIYAVHAMVRVAVAVAIWFLCGSAAAPDTRLLLRRPWSRLKGAGPRVGRRRLDRDDGRAILRVS